MANNYVHSPNAQFSLEIVSCLKDKSLFPLWNQKEKYLKTNKYKDEGFIKRGGEKKKKYINRYTYYYQKVPILGSLGRLHNWFQS